MIDLISETLREKKTTSAKCSKPQGMLVFRLWKMLFFEKCHARQRWLDKTHICWLLVLLLLYAQQAQIKSISTTTTVGLVLDILSYTELWYFVPCNQTACFLTRCQSSTHSYPMESFLPKKHQKIYKNTIFFSTKMFFLKCFS